jgi:hypothetical protein
VRRSGRGSQQERKASGGVGPGTLLGPEGPDEFFSHRCRFCRRGWGESVWTLWIEGSRTVPAPNHVVDFGWSG